MQVTEIRNRLLEVVQDFPPEYIPGYTIDTVRTAFHISLITDRKGTDCKVCDIGGGMALFAPGCAALGMQATVVDRFWGHGDPGEAVHKKYGVTTIEQDVVENPDIDFEPRSFDAITSFESVEHFHHSPKRLFANIVKYLKPGGLFVLGVPNAVDLRKRITTPFGYGSWSEMHDWYEQERFAGHVREPVLDDLRYIARDMNLHGYQIYGRNDTGYHSSSRLVRTLTAIVDAPLRLFPSLCASIYLVGYTEGA